MTFPEERKIVKLREREGQRVDLGRSLKGHLYRVPQKYRLKEYGSEGHKNGANQIIILCMFFSTSGHLV